MTTAILDPRTFSPRSRDAAPDMIPGLLLWYDARTINLSTDDPMVTWVDSSGNGNTATLGTAPLYRAADLNSGPAVQANGTTQFMISGQTARTTGTLVCVFAGTGNTDVLFGTQTASPDKRCYIAISIGGTLAGGVGSESLTTILGDIPVNDGNPHIGIMSYDGFTVKLDLDGGSEYAAAQGGGAAQNTLPYYTHGVNKDSSLNNPFAGDIGQIMAYDRALTGDEKVSLFLYLGAIYGFGFQIMYDRFGIPMTDRDGTRIITRT